MTAETILKALYAEGTQDKWRVDAEDVSVGPADGFSAIGGCGCCGSPWLWGDDPTADARRIAVLCSTDVGAALVNHLTAERAYRQAASEYFARMDEEPHGLCEISDVEDARQRMDAAALKVFGTSHALDALLSEREGGR